MTFTLAVAVTVEANKANAKKAKRITNSNVMLLHHWCYDITYAIVKIHFERLHCAETE
jgi:hypothetical protein